MLVACSSCHRQYDVGGMKAGEQVRCRCGNLVKVGREPAREARTLHCSSCGAKLRDEARGCDYCGSQITVAERNLGPACPECFARLPVGARFCSGCGVEILPQPLKATRLSARCPRCRGELVLRELPQASYTECAGCAGIWLDYTSLERVIEARDAAALAALLPPAKAAEGGAPLPDDVRYLPCPTCGQLMNRKNFAGCSGVIVDYCKGHGMWFDTHELEKVISFVSSGGMDRARKLELDRANEELERVRNLQRSALPRRGLVWEPPPPRPLDWLDALGGISSWLRRFMG
jgi:Zn-finger nucleic acid-binding protein